MRNRTYGGVRGRNTKVGRKLLRFPPTRLNGAKADGTDMQLSRIYSVNILAAWAKNMVE